MKRVVFSILAVGFLMTTVCKGASVMTMTTSSDKAKIYLAGSGTVTIDWGDGSEIITATLKEYKRRWFHIKNEYSYNYVDASSRTITITGENVTHLGCDGNKHYGLDVSSLDVGNNPALTFLECNSCQFPCLDVSNNPALTDLECRFCQFTSLDVSKNTKLSRLICQGCSLTSLDVSNNKALTGLDCSMNSLRKMDVSNNVKLTKLSCAENYFNDDALNSLFMTLNSNTGKKIILIGNIFGEEVSCDESIAKKNGRTIERVKNKKSQKNSFIPDIV